MWVWGIRSNTDMWVIRAEKITTVYHDDVSEVLFVHRQGITKRRGGLIRSSIAI